jgi:anti-sigma regulatory factor (Ser/Thr protein kinase)
MNIPAANRLSRQFEPHPQSAGEARTLLRNALAAWGAPLLYDSGSLILTEMISNALRHEKSITVEFSYRPGHLHLEVTDSSTDLPERQSPGDDEENGRGLLLISALTTEWGFRPAPGGKTVYAMLEG